MVHCERVGGVGKHVHVHQLLHDVPHPVRKARYPWKLYVGSMELLGIRWSLLVSNGAPWYEVDIVERCRTAGAVFIG
jgi:hypothetical protein